MTKVESCGRTDVGKVRTHNEDNFLIADMSQEDMVRDPKKPMSFTVGKRGGLFVVSDGVGGAAAGEIASRLSITSVYDKLSRALDDSANLSGNYFAQRFDEAINYANAVVHKKSRDNPRWSGMAATMTAALVHKETLLIGQIGDSRAYLIRRGEITQLTKDQSLVQQMIDSGKISEEEGKTFAKKNLILQALGANPTVDVILTQYKLCCRDCLVLCTDGLHGLISSDEIKSIIESSADLPQACESLIDAANAKGGTDNITVVIVKFSGEDLAPPDREDKIVYTKFKKSKTTQRTLIPSDSKKPEAPGDTRDPLRSRGHRLYLLMAVIFAIMAVLLLGAITLVHWHAKKVDPNGPVLETKKPDHETPKALQTPKIKEGSESSPNERLNHLINRAMLAFRAKRFLPPEPDNALDYCRQIIELDPSNAKARSIKEDIADHFRSLAEKSWKGSDWKSAKANYQNVLKVYPTDEEARERIRELEKKNLVNE